MKDGEEVFRELDELLYEAFGKGEEMWCEVENEAPSDSPKGEGSGVLGES